MKLSRFNFDRFYYAWSSLYVKNSKKGGVPMLQLKVPISTDEIIEAVKKMKKADREAFIEDLLAIASP